MSFYIRLHDLKTKKDLQGEGQVIRRVEALSFSTRSARHKKQSFTRLESKLSADGRTVTVLKASKGGDKASCQIVEVWDTGKGSICRVCYHAGETVTAFH